MIASVQDERFANDRLPRRDLDLSQLGRRISSNRWWLIGPTLLCLVGSTVFVNVVSPRYTGETKLLLENQESYFTRPDKTDMQAVPLPDDEAVQSQVQLVSSRDIARAAIRQLGLQGNPEFDPLADGVGPVTRLLILLGLERDPLRVPPEERMLTRYFDRLTVFPVTKSRVLTVEFESKDPDLAARAANTIADLYIDVQSSTKRDAARAAADSLRTLIADLRVRAGDAEAKAQAFRSQSGLLMGTNNTTFSSQQLTDMSTQLAQAHSAQAEAESKAKLIRDLIKGGRVSEVTEVANSDLIRRLSEQRAAAQAEIALQSRTLLPGHPRMQELTAQLSDLDKQLRAIADKTARTLDNDARIASGRVDNLTTAMNAQKATIGATGTDQVKLNELDLNARLLKDQLEFNTSKYQEAVARENAGSTPADARVISRAVAPQIPSFPLKLPIIAIATIAGALLSLGLFIARELLSGRVLMSDGVSELPVVIRADEHRAHSDPWAEPDADADRFANPNDDVGRATSIASELRATLATEDLDGLHVKRDPFLTLLDEVLARKEPDQALRVLICDSEADGVNAAKLAVRLGRVLSRSFRAIAVDVAGRNGATLQQLVGFTGHDLPGLTDLLGGGSSFAEVIHRDAQSRLHFVPAGSASKPEDDEDAMANVLDALAQTYDFAIMSGPVLLDGAPSSLLLEHADVAVTAGAAGSSVEDLERFSSLFGSPTAGGPTVFVVPGVRDETAAVPRFGVAAA